MEEREGGEKKVEGVVVLNLRNVMVACSACPLARKQTNGLGIPATIYGALALDQTTEQIETSDFLLFGSFFDTRLTLSLTCAYYSLFYSSGNKLAHY